jgi:glutaconyl-CoA/methylmalonyl-CoA decarboxylase subunit gamma
MSKKYKITVNGTAYEVEVEDIGGSSAPAPVAAPVSAPAPVAAPAPAAAPAAAPAPASGGGETVTAPMPGKVLKVAVSVGAAVNAGDLLLVLEAMKMENEIQAPSAGTVKEIKVSDGSPVNTGDVLVVLG